MFRSFAIAIIGSSITGTMGAMLAQGADLSIGANGISIPYLACASIAGAFGTAMGFGIRNAATVGKAAVEYHISELKKRDSEYQDLYKQASEDRNKMADDRVETAKKVADALARFHELADVMKELIEQAGKPNQEKK